MLSNEEKIYTVYKHTFPNNKVYIGITRRKPEERWLRGRGYYRNEIMYNAILKYGWDNIKHEILYTDLTQEEAYETEIKLIAEHNATNKIYGYNRHEGGDIAYSFDLSVKEWIECLYDYETIKGNKTLERLLNTLFVCAIGFNYKPNIKTTRYDDKGDIISETYHNEEEHYAPNLVLGLALVEKYKNVDELKEYIVRVKKTLEEYKEIVNEIKEDKL